MKRILHKDLLHSQRAERLGWLLLATLAAVLVVSIILGLRSMTAA
jgi:hypothetical protein